MENCLMEAETIEGILKLIEQRPADAELFQRLGGLYRGANRMDESRQAFERSLELDPSDAFTYFYLGNWHYYKMITKALTWFAARGIAAG